MIEKVDMPEFETISNPVEVVFQGKVPIIKI